MKKLYRVEVSKELWVYAEDETTASELAVDNVNDDGANFDAFPIEIKSETEIPKDVKMALVWGEDNDEQTVLDAFRKTQFWMAIP